MAAREVVCNRLGSNKPDSPSSAPSLNYSGRSSGQHPSNNIPTNLTTTMSSTRGPRLNQAACIGEEVKIGVHLAIERFRLDEKKKELEFPSSFTATERAYIHRLCQSLGLKSKSRGKGANRFLTIYKKDGVTLGSWTASFQLARNSRHQIMSLLQRLPLTSRERADLQPRTHKMSVSEVTREFNKTTTGRLNNGVPQVPPRRGESDLSSFRQTLPVFAMRDEILAAISNNQVVLVSGETGSGKTTQVPQIILDDCSAQNQQCRILCTQPRRIAALAIAERVAAERGERIGQTVGYQIRLESKVSPKTLLTFCTNGVLLRTLMGRDSPLSTVTHVIVDEVHERDRFSDFLLACLKEALPRHPRLKVILMSAALNVHLFTAYFSGCPVVSVPGSLFPVEDYFLEDLLRWTNYSNKVMDKLRREQQNVSQQQEKLNDWCTRQLTSSESESLHNQGDSFNSDTTDPSSSQVAEEQSDPEPAVCDKMDELLSSAWLSGSDEAFHQILHLILCENVSVDYAHSSTTATALMVASGRGFVTVVEQLLSLGANVCLRASNGWTALDWAQRFQQQEVVELLQANIAVQEALADAGSDVTADDLQLVSPEDRELLSLYQHSFDDDKVDVSLVVTVVQRIHTTQPDGAILVFLPGYDDIVAVGNAINESSNFERCKVLVLHSAMQSSEQKKIFSSFPRLRKIILSTNLAETSITINDVVYVVDTGKVKEKAYDGLMSTSTLRSNWISKASALQRKGRAGRCRPGKCYHLFSRARYVHLMEYQQPEILRLPLHELCLHTKLLAPSTVSIAEFLGRCPQPPPFLIIRNAVTMLKQMDALDDWEELTELGHHLTDLPVEPRLGKMVLHAVVLKCLDPVLTIVCILAHKDPFQLPTVPSQKRSASMARHKFAAGTFSDHMALLRAFQMWQKARTEGWERSFCEKNFLSAACMEMVVGMRAQLLGQLRASGFVRARGGGDIRDLNTNSENWAVVKAALCAGMYPNLLYVDRKKSSLITQRESNVRFHQSSVLSILPSAANINSSCHKQAVQSLPCDWLIYEEITRTERLALVKCCTLLSPITVLIFAGPAKLPPDAMKEGENLQEGDEMIDGRGEESDSEGEDKTGQRKSQLQLDSWVTFTVDAEAANMGIQLRQKWHALFLRRMRAPSKPSSQNDEEVVRAVVNVLTNEEQAVGLQQPAGIGQRPRPMSAESIMSGASSAYTDNFSDDCTERLPRHGPLCRIPSTPPRGPFQTSKSCPGDDADVTPPSPSCTPCPSPSPQSASPTRSGGGSSSGGSLDSSCDPGASSTAPCHYFVMKCNNQRNLDISQSKAIWATSPANQAKMNRAFRDGKTVYLIFSIQGSGHFQGYARMLTEIGRHKSAEFSSPGLSGTFAVEWIKRANIPFMSTHHLYNTWNENRKVQVSRDGQELEPSVGEALLKLWDRYPTLTHKHGSPPSGVTKTVAKKSLCQPDSQHQQQEIDAAGDRVNGRTVASEFTHKLLLDDKGEGQDRPESAHSLDGQSLTATTLTTSSLTASSATDGPGASDISDGGSREGGSRQAWMRGESSSFGQNKQFGQHYTRSRASGNSVAASFSPAACTASMPGPAGSFGVFPSSQAGGGGQPQQMTPGFSPVYAVGPKGGANNLLSTRSSYPAQSSVMILQRGSSASHSAGVLAPAFGSQAVQSAHESTGHTN